MERGLSARCKATSRQRILRCSAKIAAPARCLFQRGANCMAPKSQTRHAVGPTCKAKWFLTVSCGQSEKFTLCPSMDGLCQHQKLAAQCETSAPKASRCSPKSQHLEHVLKASGAARKASTKGQRCRAKSQHLEHNDMRKTSGAARKAGTRS